MRYYTPIRTLQIKRLTVTNVAKALEQFELSCIAGRNIKTTTTKTNTLENWAILTNLRII